MNGFIANAAVPNADAGVPSILIATGTLFVTMEASTTISIVDTITANQRLIYAVEITTHLIGN